MDPENIIDLFDSCWFTPSISIKPYTPSNLTQNPHHQFQENPLQHLSKLPSILMRSKSDDLSSMTTSFTSDLSSPNSVLVKPSLQTIPSGKELRERESVKHRKIEETLQKTDENRGMKSRGIKRKEKSTSKSLSDLEFEELKGFMDLGFVFSEEDKDSRLVEIIPGLQRFGKKNANEKEKEEENGDECLVSRPYLSEKWEYLEREKRENDLLMNWKVPAPDNEIDMKDSLKWWAHTVASVVR